MWCALLYFLQSGGGGSGGGDSTMVFRSYDKSSGVSLRSGKVKMPPSIGQKKAKIIEQCLEDLHICM